MGGCLVKVVAAEAPTQARFITVCTDGRRDQADCRHEWQPFNTSTLRGSPTTRAAVALKTFRLKGFPEWMRQREKCGGAEIPGTRVDEQNERQVTSR